MHGCNLVLWDNSPFLSYYSQAEKTHISFFGNEKLTPVLYSNNEIIQNKIDYDLLERKFEKSIVEFKKSSLNRMFRKLKRKLKIEEYEDMKMFQAVIYPHIFRWIFLTYTLLYTGVVVWLFLYKNPKNPENQSRFHSEGKFILYAR